MLEVRRRAVIRSAFSCQTGVNTLKAIAGRDGQIFGLNVFVWCEEGDSNPHTIAGVRT